MSRLFQVMQTVGLATILTLVSVLLFCTIFGGSTPNLISLTLYSGIILIVVAMWVIGRKEDR